MSLCRHVIVALLWLHSACWAVQAQSVPVTPGSVEGRVQNALTGDPIAGASVVMACLTVKATDASCGRTPTTSHPDGTFRFDGVAPGSYLVSGTEDGFVSMPGESLAVASVEAGQLFSRVMVKLTPEATIKGKIVDDAGTPMAGISVEALAIRRSSGRSRLSQSSRASADKSGTYTLNRLAPGTYYFAAQAPKPDKSSASVRFFYPNAPSAEQATSVQVEAGQSYEGINIRLHAVATYRVQGRVAEFAGLDEKLKSQLRLDLESEAQTLPAGDPIRLGTDGSFDIGGVAPGSYVLRLKGLGSSLETDTRMQAMFQHQLARQEISIDGSDVTGVVLSISPPITVSGRIITPESSAAPNLAQTQISLRPIESAVSSYMSAKPQPAGSFQFPPCDAVSYAVKVVAPPGFYVQSVEFNRQDVLSHVMDLSGGTGGELVVSLGVGGAALSGTFESSGNGEGQPQLPRYVFLIPANWNPEISGDVTPRIPRNGVFAFKDLAPGKYVLVALEWIGSADLLRTPNFIQALRCEGIAVELRQNDHLQEAIPVVSDDDVKRLLGRLGLN